MSEMNFKNRGEQVFETLKREILDLKLEPGRMISENEICERFGVSRTPVRDALRLLQEQGFVETVPYSCLLYTSPSPRDRQKSRMPSSA